LLPACFRGSPKPKLAEQYKRWLDQDVVYIITDEERKRILALTADEQREKSSRLLAGAQSKAWLG